MSSQQHHSRHHDEQSHCPQCNHKYQSSSQNEQQSDQKQRIIIPIRRDLLSGQNNQTQQILKNLQIQIQNLKNSNNQKDKMIEDLKKQIQHKMTHYMIFGQINKQADQINKLKTSINFTSNIKNSRKKQVDQHQIRSIFRQESKRFVDFTNNSINRQRNIQRPIIYRSQSKFKTHSTHENYSTLRKQLMSPKKQVRQKNKKNKDKKDQQQSQMIKQYYDISNQKQVFKIGQSKKKIAQLQQKIKIYEKQMLWMSNFVCTFIKTMQNIAYKKYQQQIIIPQWTLKKKAKTSWRYMKHVFKFLYQDQK